MTENKRFTITQDFEEHHRQIRDNGHIIMGCFIEPQAKVIVDMLNELNDENEQLKAQLYCDSEEGVCIICKHHYLEKGNIFYISKCEKGHEECSTDALKHCKDFEIKESKNE